MSMAQDDDGATRIRHPNREKSSSQVTKAFVALLLVASAALVAIVTIGGWNSLQGAQIVSVLYVIVYLIMAYFVMTRWTRGVLPLSAALATGLAVFAVIAAPGWFDRDEPNYAEPALPASLLGLLVILIAIVQVILIIAAMIGFQQKWNIEVEEHDDDGGQQGYGGGRAQPAGAGA
jgi:FtsH-binding integral membrane protein